VVKIYLSFNWHAVLQCSFIAIDCWRWWTAVVSSSCASKCITCWHWWICCCI